MSLLFSFFVLFVLVLQSKVFAQSTVYPSTTCFDKPIPEGGTLSCDCTGNATAEATQNSAASFSWPGYSNSSSLKLENVRRELNGTVFVCVMEAAGEENKTANFTLEVVFGPSEENTRVIAPETFITDGSRKLNLSCQANDTHPPPRISWSSSLSCEDPDSDTCVLEPRVPDDGMGIICIATNPVFPPVTAAWAYYFLNLSYPPITEPEVATAVTTTTLRTGNTITCTVTGGKPLVSSVIFNCSNPALPDLDDVIGVTSVSSSVVIDTSSATADVTLCTCRATWEPEPELYTNVTEERFFLEYQAKIDKFTVNGTTEIAILEDDQQAILFQCDVIARASASVTLHKQGNHWKLGNTDDVTGNNTDIVERHLVHTHTLTSAKCEDMGTYSCTADSGFLDDVTESVRLTVSCGPRLYNGSLDPPPVLTADGLQLYFVAHPLPERIQYSFDFNSTLTLTEDNQVLNVDCQRHIQQRHLVVCSFRRARRGEEYFGEYTVTIANHFGVLQFRVNVRDADEPLISAATAQLIAGLLAAAIFAVIVVVIICFVREKQARKYRSQKNEEDPEATDQPRSASPSASDDPDNDPSIPFREVKQPSSVSKQRDKQSRHSASASSLAAVIHRSSDVIFKEAKTKPADGDDSFFDVGELPAYSKTSPRGSEGKGVSDVVSVGTGTGWGEDSTLYETGYMSVDLSTQTGTSPTRKTESKSTQHSSSPGETESGFSTGRSGHYSTAHGDTESGFNTGRSGHYSTAHGDAESGFSPRPSGPGYALETKQRTFITKIFLPEKSDGRGDSSTEHDPDYDEASTLRRDEYAQVNKARKPAEQKDTGTTVDEDGLENEIHLDDFELDDTEDEKMASIDLEDEEEEESSESTDSEDSYPHSTTMYEIQGDEVGDSMTDENLPRTTEMYEIKTKLAEPTEQRGGMDSLKRRSSEKAKNEAKAKRDSGQGTPPQKPRRDSKSNKARPEIHQGRDNSGRRKNVESSFEERKDDKVSSVDRKADIKAKSGKGPKQSTEESKMAATKRAKDIRDTSEVTMTKRDKVNQDNKVYKGEKHAKQEDPTASKGGGSQDMEWRPEPKKRKKKKLLGKKKKSQESPEEEKYRSVDLETDASEAELLKTL